MSAFYYVESEPGGSGERLIVAWDGQRFERAGVERGSFMLWKPLPDELRRTYEAQLEEELRAMVESP